jgi:hypothetical protein
MKTFDGAQASGEVDIVLWDKDFSVKEERHVKNLLVATGLAFMISRMKDTSKAVMSHMGVGAGATAPAADQTGLISALGARVSLTATTIAGTNNEKIVYTATFGAGISTGAITEAGIFNALTGGDMLNRVVFAVVNKGADDTLGVTWTVTQNASA